MKNKVITPFQPSRHQHKKCQQTAIEAAREHCAAAGLRLTPLRQQVLALVWENHEPVKAYDILDKLKQERSSSAPPTVYRALEFLQEQGLVHKIESLNAYVGCGSPAESHRSSQFLICKLCGCVAELDDADIKQLLKTKAEKVGFDIARETVEITGYCSNCSKRQQAG
ncbi:MAG: Fur family transcriptional regulator [Gammaproteobacteria bacterium]